MASWLPGIAVLGFKVKSGELETWEASSTIQDSKKKCEAKLAVTLGWCAFPLICL
jgi:hypothetical protein